MSMDGRPLTQLRIDETGVYVSVDRFEVAECDDPDCPLIHIRIVPGFREDAGTNHLAERLRMLASGLFETADMLEEGKSGLIVLDEKKMREDGP